MQRCNDAMMQGAIFSNMQDARCKDDWSLIKEAVSQDFRTLFFFMNRTHLGPWQTV